MGGPDNRYRAFISYSQQDKDWGRRIHTWLETYRVPAGVVAAHLGAQGGGGAGGEGGAASINCANMPPPSPQPLSRLRARGL